MKTAKEWVDQINATDIRSPYEVFDMEDAGGVAVVATLNRDEYRWYRWYVMGTMVFKVGEEFFGVEGPVELKSESMGWKDVGAKCEAFEMEQVPSVTYKRKRKTKPPFVGGSDTKGEGQ